MSFLSERSIQFKNKLKIDNILTRSYIIFKKSEKFCGGLFSYPLNDEE